jgi:lipopolysaccharide transport system permease protein
MRALLLVAVMLYFRISPHPSLLLAPLGVLALIGLGIAIGLVLTPIGMLYQDIGRGLGFATAAWFFLTPVIYPVPKASFAATLIELNPVTPLLVSTREWLVVGEASLLPGFLWVSGLSLLLLMFAWVQYRLAMPHLISRMSA